MRGKMKILKSKKVLLAIFFGFIRQLKTDQFQNDDELVQYRDKIKPVFEALLPEYVKLWAESLELQKRVSREGLNAMEVQKIEIENNTRFAKLDFANEGKVVELEFEDADFNFVFDLFGKIGKKAFTNPERYLEFRDALNVTNRQTADKSNKK